MKPKISVVIPAYNAKGLEDTLKSVRSQGFKGMELIVVDDCSTDGTTIKVARKYADKVLINKVNSGPAVTRNRGIKVAKADIIAFIDSDCVAAKGWLNRLYGEVKAGNDVVMGNVTIPKSTVMGDAISALGFPAGGMTGFEKMWKVDKGGYTDHISSCNLAVRKGVFEKHGMFDESFPLAGGEDSEFSYRLAKRGVKIKFGKGALVYHEPRTSFMSFVRWQIMRGESNYHFKRKVGEIGGFMKLRAWSSRNIMCTYWNDPKFLLIIFLLLLSFVLQMKGYFYEKARNR